MGESAKEALVIRTQKIMREQKMAEEGTGILAAVSGGADSLCLLDLLDALRKTAHFPLRAVHVHHGIRKSADRDAALAEAFCRKRDIPCSILRVDVPAYAKEHRLGLEEAARILRYEALESVAEDWEREAPGLAVRIALAHHLEDQAETVLFHIARGSGIAGLAGMRYVSGRKIRPLLDVSRGEIEACLLEDGIAWAEDETNADVSYARNRIRLRILPEMVQEINAGSVRHLAALSSEAGEMEDYLQEETRKALLRVLREDGGIDLGKFREEPELLQKRIVFAVLAEHAGQKKDLTREHVQGVLALAARGGSARIDLPCQLQAAKRYDALYFVKRGEKLPEGPLPVPEREEDYAVRVFPFSGRMADIPQKKYTKWFDYDKISSAFSFRRRRPGDVITIEMAPRTEDGSLQPSRKKSIKKFMIDVRMPAQVRDRILLPVCGSEVLWVPGFRCSAAYLVSEETKRIMEISTDGGEDGGYDHNTDSTGES